MNMLDDNWQKKRSQILLHAFLFHVLTMLWNYVFYYIGDESREKCLQSENAVF